MRGKYLLLSAMLLLAFFISTSVFSQPPASQTVGGVTRQEREIEEKRQLEKKIEKERPAPEGVLTEEMIPDDSGPKVMVEKIVVEGVTLLTEEEIQKITSIYEGHELSLKAMQKVADFITDEYRKKGYATSRAYLPPQRIKEGVLIIRVVEGKLGNVEIKGNKYFKTALIERKLDITPRGYFDYSALQQALVYINEHPDRVAKAILVPGKEPGTTDLVIEVEDRLPVHAGFEYDNYGSRYIGEDRYALILEHNNLLGFDDKAYLKFQRSDASHLELQQFRYSFPVTPTLDVGGYFLRSTLKLGEEFAVLEAKGKAYIYGLFASKALITREDFDLRLSLGFDYKKIKNDLLGTQNSRDALRVFKTGLDIDKTDRWGRTVFLPELDVGVDDILGGMKEKDENASRTGAGAKFTKGVFTLFRLQPMPWETSLLWKNFAQYTNYNLAAAEQFQIGGPVSVRGYPPAEYSGDKGYYTSFELSFPCYCIKNKDYRVPFTKESLYDSLRFVTFWDWAFASFNSVQPAETKKHTLKGIGVGVRLNVRDNLAFRVEFGWPLGGPTPSDSDHMHPWIECVWRF